MTDKRDTGKDQPNKKWIDIAYDLVADVDKIPNRFKYNLKGNRIKEDDEEPKS